MEISPISTRPAVSGPSETRPVAAVAGSQTAQAAAPHVAVEPAPQSQAAGPEPGRQTGAGIDRRFEVDPTTHEVVFQAVDTQSGEVVRQVPEEAMLRLQIYARAMRRGGAEPRDDKQVERIA